MKSIVLVLVLVAVAFGAPPFPPFRGAPQPSFASPQPRIPIGVKDDSRNAVILRYDSDNIGVDGYSYAVETSDGQSKQEQGQLINPGTENESLVARGQYSYTGPDGVVYTVTYVADENGFQPQGAHLPVAQ